MSHFLCRLGPGTRTDSDGHKPPRGPDTGGDVGPRHQSQSSGRRVPPVHDARSVTGSRPEVTTDRLDGVALHVIVVSDGPLPVHGRPVVATEVGLVTHEAAGATDVDLSTPGTPVPPSFLLVSGGWGSIGAPVDRIW